MCTAGGDGRRGGSPARALAAFGLVALVCAADAPPRSTELIEQAHSRLIQIEVTALGPPESTADLGPADFRVRVGFKRITDFHVDRHCGPVTADGLGGPRPPAYLLYFDQPHLTPPGRQRAIDLAREMVPLLVQGGGRVMLLSEADRLALLAEPTGDAAALDAALEHLAGDRTQWDFYAADEDWRVGRVVDALNEDGDVQRGVALARSFQREERWRTEKSLRRLALALVRLQDLEGPKIAIYFGDTIRSNAGEHYLSFFGHAVLRTQPELRELGLDSVAAGLSFDRLINEAVAQSIRFYPVLARGLVVPVDEDRLSGGAQGRTWTVPNSSRTRFHDTENTLRSLAAETGGQAFLTGDAGRRVAERIRQDLACTYVISFPPAGLGEDAPLRVGIDSTRAGVTLQAQGRLVVQSEPARLASRLLSAFAVDRPDDEAADLRAALVPTGFRHGTYSALLQLAVPTTSLPAPDWTVGASIVARDKVIEEVSGRLGTSGPGVQLILERELRLPPGALEIAAVAHEERTGFILSQHVHLLWPDPDAEPLTLGPIAVFQPAAAAFVRAGDTRRVGSLFRTASETVVVDQPVALLGLVCRGRRFKGALRIERRLVGERELAFPNVDFDLGADDERCAQVRDLVPAGALAPGTYRYTVRVLHDGLSRTEGSREFRAVSGGS